MSKLLITLVEMVAIVGSIGWTTYTWTTANRVSQCNDRL